MHLYFICKLKSNILHANELLWNWENWGCKHGLFFLVPKSSIRKLWSSFSGHLSHSFNFVFISVSLTSSPQCITMKFQGLYSPSLALQSITRFLYLSLTPPLILTLPCGDLTFPSCCLSICLSSCCVHVSLQMLLHYSHTSHMDAHVLSHYIIFSYIKENVPRQYTTENLTSFLISHSLCNSQSFWLTLFLVFSLQG